MNKFEIFEFKSVFDWFTASVYTKGYFYENNFELYIKPNCHCFLIYRKTDTGFQINVTMMVAS